MLLMTTGAAVLVLAVPGSQLADTKDKVSVDVELIIGVDVSYSMDIDELAVQREGYAQAIVSKEFLQALKTGPNRKLAVTYFEWAASSDQTTERRLVPEVRRDPRVPCLIGEMIWQQHQWRR